MLALPEGGEEGVLVAIRVSELHVVDKVSPALSEATALSAKSFSLIEAGILLCPSAMACCVEMYMR